MLCAAASSRAKPLARAGLVVDAERTVPSTAATHSGHLARYASATVPPSQPRTGRCPALGHVLELWRLGCGRSRWLGRLATPAGTQEPDATERPFTAITTIGGVSAFDPPAGAALVRHAHASRTAADDGARLVVAISG